MLRYYILLGITLLGITLPDFQSLHGQYLPSHISNEGIYLYLDELASAHIIDLHSLIKPYSRVEIANKLREAELQRSRMNSRQAAELDFYRKDYMKEGDEGNQGRANWLWQKKYPSKRFDFFYYGDSLFRLNVNPILGGDFWTNQNGSFYHWWNGLEASARVGKFAFWASLRDNHESTLLTSPDFQNQRIGAGEVKLVGDGMRDYEEFRGGVTYSWAWGHAGLIMDQFSWGENNAGSNILSGRSPSFARLELSLKPVSWFRFDYVHASLNSMEVDSMQSFYTSNAYGSNHRLVYHPKFMAANMFTFIPFKGLQLAVGNSIIYDQRTPDISMLIPLAFFKAIDHTSNAGIDNMNSQLFFSLSSRNLKRFHFYASWFIDELATGRLFDPDEYNFFSWKAGFSSTLVPNMRMAAEYTWTNCLTFMHFVPTTTFESNKYNLGHYLEDNARDIYVSLAYSPWRSLRVKAYLNHSSKGPDHTELGTTPRMEIPPLDPVVWESTRIGLLARMQIINDLYVSLGYEWRRVEGEQAYVERWTPEVYHGESGTLRLGLNYGF